MNPPHDIRLDYRAPPSALAFMLGAVWPSPGFKRGVPAIAARWRHRPEAAEVARFLALGGSPGGTASPAVLAPAQIAQQPLPFLYPQAIAFRLQMAALTRPVFPLPIWRMLQIRNRILQHAPLAPDAELDIEVRLVGDRLLDKGAEFDMHAVVRQEGAAKWECLNTFYARGRFGAATASSVPQAPKVSPGSTAQWRTPAGGGWRFGSLTGDYNPLHLWNGYARKRGHAGASFHPQRVLGQCLARLAQGDALPLRLDAWIKGPVFYDAPVELKSENGAAGTRFALHVADDARPAVVGELRRGEAGGIPIFEEMA